MTTEQFELLVQIQQVYLQQKNVPDAATNTELLNYDLQDITETL